MQASQTFQPRFIKPRNILKEKMGHGSLDKSMVAKAQKVMDEGNYDFSEMSDGFLADFRQKIDALNAVYSNNGSDIEASLSETAASVMQIKANGKMFGFPLFSSAAAISLTFIEDLEQITPDVFDVLNVHHKTLIAIAALNLRDETSPQAKALVNELAQASERYFKKHGS